MITQNMKIYGYLTIGDREYAILRPHPFLSEYSPPFDLNQDERCFYVCYFNECDALEYYNPHVMVVSGNYILDVCEPVEKEVHIPEPNKKGVRKNQKGSDDGVS